jgi:hypothetical protein
VFGSLIERRYEAVLAEGTSAQVIELLDLYRSVNPRVAVLSAAAKAKEIVAAAESAAPTSLTDIPGGAAHHDEIGAIREMGDAALMTKFEGKSSEQILALLNRVI